ncbi:MAG: hypothetical protein ABJQ29_08980 [Luteolibacter sp.]
MSASTERPVQAVLTPWVIALIALIGLNAFSQEYSRTRRDESSGKITLTQSGEFANATGNFTGSLVFLTAQSSHHAAILVSQILGLEVTHEEPLAEFPHGAVRGRAPPAGLLA